MIDALASTAYLAEGTSNPAILLHGSIDVPRNRGVDVGLTYGDHYFLEALARRPQTALAADGGQDGGAGTDGGADGGTRGTDAGFQPIDPQVPVASGRSGCASGGGAGGFSMLGAPGGLRAPRRPRGICHSPPRAPRDARFTSPGTFRPSSATVIVRLRSPGGGGGGK